MATAVTDAYIKQILNAKTNILACFKHAHELLTVREATLLTELEEIQRKYEDEAIRYEEELQNLDLERSMHSQNSLLLDNDTLDKSLSPLNEKIERIVRLSSTTQTIRFQWNTDAERDMQKFGEIITSKDSQSAINEPVELPYEDKYIPAITDYEDKSTPVITSCRHRSVRSGAPNGDLCFPRGLAIELQAGRIYIAEFQSNRVQVFNSNGNCLFIFNDKMCFPYGIYINNQTVYVSQWYGHRINLYSLDGVFISAVGSNGASHGQFSFPAGIAVNNVTSYLYVCDSGNNILQIFDKSLKFQQIFGKNYVDDPRDVKLSNNYVIVLDKGNPCIHLFNSTDHSLASSIISRGDGELISHSLFFTIDKETNIVMTDYNYHRVRIFNLSGEFITQFGNQGHTLGKFFKPVGIAIDSQNRIAIASENANNALQIF